MNQAKLSSLTKTCRILSINKNVNDDNTHV